MGQFKKYATYIMAFFIPFIWVTLFQFYSFTSPVLCTKNNKLWTERKEYFLYIWMLHCIALYQRRQKIVSLDTIAFLDTRMQKQSIQTKQWNYNIFVQVLHSYLRYTDRHLDVFFLLLAVILSDLHKKPRKKD